MSLSYDSGVGNGPFGLGWSLGLPAVTRKTERGLPRYDDAEESDVFIISGAEDLVPVRAGDGEIVEDERDGHRIRRYRPRVEGLFARIERWTELATGDVHWRSVSPTNVTTLYGASAESRVANPRDPAQVFTWLICETHDDKGNAVVYEYEPEDSANVDTSQVNERNRTDVLRSANRYLKRVKYGNRTSRLVEPDLTAGTWLFELLFDYDEGHYEELPPAEGETPRVRASERAVRPWSARPDPFSRHRSGFEVRTYRRCRRILMLHRFDELGDEPVLVHSTELGYADLDYAAGPDVDAELAHQGSTRFASVVRSVTQAGYIKEDVDPVVVDGATFLTYRRKLLPPVELTYSRPRVGDAVEDVESESVENLPIGLDGNQYRWVDLDGEGLPGILLEDRGAWYYKRNVSARPSGAGDGAIVARLAPVERLASVPLPAVFPEPLQIVDLAGDGQLDVADFDGDTEGFFERTLDEEWNDFRSFQSLPNVKWDDPQLRLVDLTGDGLADVVITEDDVIRWHPSLGEDGFGPGRRVSQALDEEKGPRLLFADGTESIYLADMSGDGLTDLVRIKNGDVCFWPNRGYGRFGAKVTMDDAPWFDSPDQFEQSRVRVADIDGSGVTDVIYLGRNGVRLYFNQSGNRWTRAKRVRAFPRVDDASSVAVVDLLGTGTACLVWSSPLPRSAERPMRYLRLMVEKPHLLMRVVNNVGGESTIRYSPSTTFYLADKAAGKPWATRLPFPVHVVDHVEAIDHVSGTRLASTYAYHHGYFDRAEREFRGFGMVEQVDAESFEDYVVGIVPGGNQDAAPELYQPPVVTRTWFHCGADRDGDAISRTFTEEYFQGTRILPDAVLPATNDARDLRECVRALKGMPVRREVYSFDGSPQEDVPYSVTESGYRVALIQAHGPGEHAVCHALPVESVAVYYDRDTTDPRVAHGLNLAFGPHGEVERSASVAYGRALADPALPAEVNQDQQRLRVTYMEVDYTDDIDDDATYRLRAPCEARSYELTGVPPAGELFTAGELDVASLAATPIPYEQVASGLVAERRPLTHERTVFLDDALNPLPHGEWDTLGLVSRRFMLAFTPSVVAANHAGHVSDADFLAAGYVHFEGDANWWIPSGTSVYPAAPEVHFYIPTGARDALGGETIAELDQYDLLVERVRTAGAAWTEVEATNDYRVLGPVGMVDPNKNRSAVEMDELGFVVKTAVMGKAGDADGDSLADPTARMEYELFNWLDNGKPNFVHTFTRERHGAANTGWRESYAYSNGGGGTALVKVRARAGKALRVEDDGSVTEVDADPRWIGNGRTLVNNKGNPVKRYEPYFSTTFEYEDERAVRELGETSILFYDAVGRNVRTLHPNGTESRTEHQAWRQRVFDANDTVTESAWYADRGSPDPAVDPEPLADPERRAAWLAAKHAGTPAEVHLDNLGRSIYAVSDFGGGRKVAARTAVDLTGRYVALYDQKQRQISSGFVGMTGLAIYGESAEKGRRWSFVNVLGGLVKSWDEHGRELRAEYDALHRPLSTFVKEGAAAEALVQHVVYGDRHPNGEALNLLGTTHLVFDQAGLVRVPGADFKGNPLRAERILARDFQHVVDWSAVASQAAYADVEPAAAPALLTGEVFGSSATYDALNRPLQITLPDGTVMQPSYDAGGTLTQLRARIHGAGPFREFLVDQEFDARGHRLYARYGNGLVTRPFYDAKTFDLVRLLTHPDGADPATTAVQDLRYTHDPVGNVTQARDAAQQSYFFANAVVVPEARYEYDALYQLVRATGREHAVAVNDSIRTRDDVDAVPQLPHPNDVHAVRTYLEEYDYDDVGNITQLRHRFQTQAGVGAGWTRRYRYAYEDDPADSTNRLTSTSLPGDPDAGPYSATYDYDDYGNMTRMPSLPGLEWNFMDQLRHVDLGGGGDAYYVYGAGGQRIRKVVDLNPGTQLEWIFLGAVMIFRRRRRATGEVALERWTVHVSDGSGQIAQVSVKTVDLDGADPANPIGVPLVRYQYSDGRGSTGFETDADGNVVSHEEYHPFGSSAYRASAPGNDVSLKRFRFAGKERDDETGLYYFGARYYAPWLGRWTSTDPIGAGGGFNLFRYCANNPVMFRDPTGLQRTTIIRREHYTGEESLQSLVAQIPRGYHLDPAVTEENYRSYWDPARHVWNIAQRDGPGSVPGAGSTASVGRQVVQSHPEGQIHEVAENFDDAKIDVYRERIEARDIGIRSRDPGSTSRTAELRREVQPLRDQYEAALPGGQRPPGTDIDHTPELQDMRRGATTPPDHRPQASGVNRSQGASQQAVNRRRLAEGIPEDVPAGAVARGSEMGNPRLQPGYRGAVRGIGYGLMWAGPLLTLYGASQIENEAVRDAGYGLGGTELVGAGTYTAGRWLMGGGAAGNAGGLRVMGIGGGMMRFAGGTAGIVFGAYGLVNDVQHENYGVVLSDAANIVAGGAVLAGSAPVAAIATGVAVSNVAGDWVESKVTPSYGRGAGVAAGTLAGAGTGALVGAAVGVWFFGVGAPVGAAVGGVIGGVAGFIGAYW
jgi:RHS repeat-associated protein